MKLGLITAVRDPEPVSNTLRLTLHALKQRGPLRILLPGRGAEAGRIGDTSFNLKAWAQEVLNADGQFPACGAYLKLRNSKGSEVFPRPALTDRHEPVRHSREVITL